MHKEINIVSGGAESSVSFRMVGLSSPEMHAWQSKLKNIQCEWHKMKGRDKYVCLCLLDDIDKVQELKSVLTGSNLPGEYGIYVSIVTDRDNDGLRLSSYVSDFYREIGGAIDFSFVCV